MLPAAEAALLARGCAIPAHPLALDANRKLDERHQRALTRYYMAAGAGGVAVGVHTTQFAIRSAGLLAPVLTLAKEAIDAASLPRPFIRIAGAIGGIDQAVAEAELAASLGYHAVLLGPADLDEDDLVLRAKVVGDVLPVIGFYLQEAVGGRRLSPNYWRALAEVPTVVAAKIAPFDRYRTAEAVRGIALANRGHDVALYTGNDDSIVADLLTPVDVADAAGRTVRKHFVGGLLGQWAVGTRAAVRLLARIHAREDPQALLALGAQLTDYNAALFDARNGFAGCIAGVNEVLHRQGLLAGWWCLDPSESMSPDQAAEITRVHAAYPDLTDDAFIQEHLDDWLR